MKFNRSALSFEFTKRADFIGLASGAVIGWLFGSSAIETLSTTNPFVHGMMIKGFGNNWNNWLTFLNIIFGASIGFGLTRVINTWLIQNRMTDPSTLETIKDYKLPNWIKPRTAFSLTLGEQHEGENFILNPTWARIPEKGLYGNIIAFGGIGSGKTASVANPIMRQIMEFANYEPDKKMGGLVLDVKGDFAAFVVGLSDEYHRSEDTIIIKPGGDYSWNPINEIETKPETLAGRLLAVYQNVSSDSGTGEQAWVSQGILKLLTHTIGLLREFRGYITIHDCNEWISDIANGDITTIEKALKRWDARKNDEDSERYLHHKRYFTHEWPAESDRSRGVYVSATKNVTSLFSVPEVKETFSPKEAKINFPGFDEIINKGNIVIIDMPDSEYGVLANAVGTLLKLSFQRAVLSRIPRAKKDKTVNTTRSLFFICDEYQKFVSVSGSAGEGDEQFYALSRQAKNFSLLLTQSPMSLVSKIGEDAARVMFASIRTKLFLSMIEPYDADLAAKTLGEDWVDTENVSFTETVSNAGFNPVDESISGTDASVSESRQLQQTRRYLIEPIKITQLKTFECYTSIFDGIKQKPPSKIYLKTDFIPSELSESYDDPRQIPYNKLINVFESGVNKI